MMEALSFSSAIEPARSNPPLAPNATIVASKDLLCCDLAGDAVILDLKSGVYYGLDPVGTFIWGLVQEPRALNEIAAAIMEAYDVDEDRCRQDLQALLAEMTNLKLIEVKDDSLA